MKGFLRLLRKVLRIPAPQVNGDKALQIAEAEAHRREAKLGRMVAHEGLRRWSVWIDADSKGSPVVEIDNCTSEVMKWTSLPR